MVWLYVLLAAFVVFASISAGYVTGRSRRLRDNLLQVEMDGRTKTSKAPSIASFAAANHANQGGKLLELNRRMADDI